MMRIKKRPFALAFAELFCSDEEHQPLRDLQQ